MAVTTGEPQLPELIKLYESCSPVTNNGWDRLTNNDAVRYNQWDGKSSDGKKWDKNLPNGKPAFPWDGASDCEVPLSDEIINDRVDMLTEAFWRAVARVEGVEPGDMERSGYMGQVIDWMRSTKLAQELHTEVELLAQNGETYGVSLLHTTWVREMAYKIREVDLEGLAKLFPEDSPLQVLIDLIEDPAHEGDAMELFETLYFNWVRERLPKHIQWEPRELKEKRLRQIIRDLRDGKVVKVPVPYVCKDQPCIRALKLWEDVFVPADTTDIQSARAIFVRDWVTEAELRSMALSNDWDADWVEEVVKQKGISTAWTVRSADATAAKLITEVAYIENDRSDKIELLTAYQRQVDEDGVMGIYYTVFHPKVTAKKKKKDLVGAHELLNYAHNRYPFAAYRSEILGRALLASRGVPQVASSWQRVVKVQEDSITDRTSLATVPPVIVPQLMGVDFRYGPAVMVPVPRMDMKPEFMQSPTGETRTAFELWDRIERRSDRYFGRRRPELPPEQTVVKQQKKVRAFLFCCSEALNQMVMLMEQFMDPQEFQRITGAREPMVADPEEIGKQYDYVLTFDVQELSQEFAMAKLDAISKSILPEDAAGVIDRVKLVRLKLRAIDPNYERELVSSEASASQALFRQVQTDLAMMFLGNEPEYVENDPTAAMQVQYAQQIIQMNQKYMLALKEDPQFAELLKKWVKNRQFSVMQDQNKQNGRIGIGQ